MKIRLVVFEFITDKQTNNICFTIFSVVTTMFKTASLLSLVGTQGF